MSNLQKSLAHWEASTIDLAGEFAKAHFGQDYDGECVRFIGDEPGGVLDYGDMFLSWDNVLEYIREGATTDEIHEHYDYCCEHDYKHVNFAYWRDRIKPKTETQPVEVRVIKNEQL